jgi:hypothetical protein
MDNIRSSSIMEAQTGLGSQRKPDSLQRQTHIRKKKGKPTHAALPLTETTHPRYHIILLPRLVGFCSTA